MVNLRLRFMLPNLTENLQFFGGVTLLQIYTGPNAL